MSLARNLSKFKPSSSGLIETADIADGAITNDKVNGSASIAKSKLASLDITNSDVNASAGISKTKLASLDIVNADINASASIAKSKLGSLAITNSDIDNSASIAQSKMSSLTAANLPAGYGADTVGMIMPYSSSSVPTGFLSCDGSAVSRSTYSVLFAKISTTWGTGDGSSTFNVPDMRGAYPRGAGTQTFNSHAYANRTVGTSVAHGVPGHTHPIVGGFHSGYGWVQYDIRTWGSTYWSSSLHGFQIQSTSGGMSNFYYRANNQTSNVNSDGETTPFTKTVLYCIKYQ